MLPGLVKGPVCSRCFKKKKTKNSWTAKYLLLMEIMTGYPVVPTNRGLKTLLSSLSPFYSALSCEASSRPPSPQRPRTSLSHSLCTPRARPPPTAPGTPVAFLPHQPFLPFTLPCWLLSLFPSLQMLVGFRDQSYSWSLDQRLYTVFWPNYTPTWYMPTVFTYAPKLKPERKVSQ